jgi:hypothetical protein
MKKKKKMKMKKKKKKMKKKKKKEKKKNLVDLSFILDKDNLLIKDVFQLCKETFT